MKRLIGMIACLAISAAGTAMIAAPAHAITAQKAASEYGTRPPRTCHEVKAAENGPPPLATVRHLVACDFEQDFGGDSILLMDKLKVQVGGPVPYHYEYMIHDADVRFPYYPIRGSFTEVSCKREFSYSTFKGRNCTIQRVTQDDGFCWHTSFGDWKCALGGTDLKQDAPVKQQPPTPGTRAG